MERVNLDRFGPGHIKTAVLAVTPPGFQPGMACVTCGQPMKQPCSGVMGVAVSVEQPACPGAIIAFRICMGAHHLTCHQSMVPPAPTTVMRAVGF